MNNYEKSFLSKHELRMIDQEANQEYQQYLTIIGKKTNKKNPASSVIDLFKENIVFALLIIFLLNFIFYISATHFEAIRLVSGLFNLLISTYDSFAVIIGIFLILSYIGYRVWKTYFGHNRKTPISNG